MSKYLLPVMTIVSLMAVGCQNARMPMVSAVPAPAMASGSSARTPNANPYLGLKNLTMTPSGFRATTPGGKAITLFGLDADAVIDGKPFGCKAAETGHLIEAVGAAINALKMSDPINANTWQTQFRKMHSRSLTLCS